jgi:hypothetical protein
MNEWIPRRRLVMVFNQSWWRPARCLGTRVPPRSLRFVEVPEDVDVIVVPNRLRLVTFGPSLNAGATPSTTGATGSAPLRD